MSKNQSLHICISDQEKSLITSLAKKSGLPISEYVRQATLNSHAPDPDNSLRQVILSQLCGLAVLCNLIEDPTVRSQIQNWRHSTWRLLK